MPNSTIAGSVRPAVDVHPVSMSEYHQACVPPQDRERAATLAAALLRRAATSTSGSMPSSLAVVIKGDALTQDRFWTRAIRMEKQSLKDWEANWKFMTEYDWKGDPRHEKDNDKEQEMTAYVQHQPRSEARNYGLHLTTDSGRKLQQLQVKYDVNHRKKRASHELGFQ